MNNPANVPTFAEIPVFADGGAGANPFRLSQWERLSPNQAFYREQKGKHAVIVQPP
ncbi:hypothetical protein [Paenibacillus sp. DMB20]|uniref:hypothetical protein n=1 Tax=Paenibacillus sp. DMB20 TaxID=1642570 RepID=UPI000B245B62|nr:hypothetical protein [Paenibacillus sp. DMB20]